jgi:hypothetical protein
LPTPLVKKSFFGTMLFPNFYVPSVGVKFVEDLERSRMSLSHLGGREQNFPQIFRRFMTENQIRNAPGRRPRVYSRPGKTKML